ncbi:flavin reductase [Porcipelethomonas sp.]|uniref:flavin reductase n=1 Tax=Porcipelethomonas sp. TaxID=2981675 RepID=UPI003EF417CD
MNFEKQNIYELEFNPFKLIGKDWFLLTSGNLNEYNTMTASWGQMGVLWNAPVFTTVVRPSRKTFELMEKNEYFTVSFFDEKYRKALSFCGSHSGRDYDKAQETGLTPAEFDGNTAFEEANLILVCRKLYTQNMETDSFLDKSLLKFYESDPLHKAFTGEIVSVYKKI